jgi:hypothetical protein
MSSVKTSVMPRIFIALMAVLEMYSALAGPEDEALAAGLRKDYAAVIKIIRPSALKWCD